MRIKYLALPLLMVLAACGQTTTIPAPKATASTPAAAVSAPALLAGPALPAADSGSAAIRPLALMTDPVVVWGYNFYGQTTVPAGLTGVTVISAGGYHNLALKNDGTVVAWGYNFSGQTTVPAGLTGVTAIAAGVFHSLALKNDGTVVAWGYNFGPVPAGLTGVTAISAGFYHSLALKNDGTVVAWGQNGEGQATVPTGLTGVKAISAGGYHSLALRMTDTTPPVITATLSPATPDGTGGWYKTPVTVTWTVVDNESAISSRSGCDSTTVSTDTTGTTLTCTATSAGGTSSQSVTVKVDVTRPALSPVLSSTGPVLLGGTLTVTPNATDATSGVASSSCTAPDTSSVGNKTLTCAATDNAGNTQTVTVPYNVVYAFRGFLAPVDNLPIVNTAKAGSAIPLKFSLSGNQGLGILAAGSPTVIRYTCAAGGPSGDLGALATFSNSGLQYDVTSDTYNYVWKTSSAMVGCYQVDVKLIDGTSHVANFQLR